MVVLHRSPVLLPCHAESSFALKAATAVPEAPAIAGSVQASTVEEAEALDCGVIVETLLCCTVACFTLAKAADKLAIGSTQLTAAVTLAASAAGAAAI